MKKLLLLLSVLLAGGVSGAWAVDTYTATYSASTASSTGTFPTSLSWRSSGTPAMTMTCSGATAYNQGNGYIFAGTYTLSVEEGYVIVGYSITGKSAWNSSNGDINTITPTSGGTIKNGSGATVTSLAFEGSDNTLNVTGLNSTTATFTIEKTAGSGNGAFNASAITITVIKGKNLVSTSGTWNNGASKWNTRWTSSATTPIVTIACSVGDMQAGTNTGTFKLHSANTNGTPYYTLSVPTGYFITGYTIVGTGVTNSVILTKSDESTTATFTTGNVCSASEEGLFLSSVRFKLTFEGTAGYIDNAAISVTISDKTAELAAYNTMRTWPQVIQSVDGLVKDAGNYSSNSVISWNGSYSEAGLPNLLDFDDVTYTMTDWWYATTGQPYIAATLPDATNHLYIAYKTRSGGSDCPKTMKVEGYDSANEEWVDQEIDLGTLPNGSSLWFVSSKLTLKDSYSKVRVVVTANQAGGTKGDGNTYFGIAELYFLPSGTEIDAAMSVYSSLKDVAYYNLTSSNITSINTTNTSLDTYYDFDTKVSDYYTSNDIGTKLSNAGKIGYPSKSSDSYNNLYDLLTSKASGWDANDWHDLQNYYPAYLSETNIILPSDGKVYTFMNVQADGTTKTYLNDVSGTLTPVNYTSGDLPETAAFICHKVADGEYVLLSKGGKYVRGPHTGGAVMSDDYNEYHSKITITKFPTGGGYATSSTPTFAFGKVNMRVQYRYETTSGDGTVFNIQKSNQKFSNSGSAFLSDAHSSAYIITEASDWYNKVTLTSDGTDAYASLYLPFSVTIPEGITAYAVASQDGESAHMEAIVTNGTLPKNTATILKKAGQDENETIYLSPATDAGSAYGETNLLSGTVVDKTLASLGTGTAYVLAKPGEDPIGLYKYTGTDMAKGKAYLFIASGGGGVKGFTFSFGNETGINSNEDVKEAVDGPIYNLAGLRMKTLQKGVNLVNGKAIIVK